VILVFAVLFMPRGIVGVLEEKVFPLLLRARRAAINAYDQP
jgi:hypothetical protein